MLSTKEADYIIERCRQQQKTTGKLNALINFQVHGSVDVSTRIGDAKCLFKDGPDGIIVGFIGSNLLDVQFNADKVIYSTRVYLDNLKTKPKGKKR